MFLEIDHSSGVPIYRQIIRQVRRHIVTGGLKPGDQLESVRELAARLNVNPMTISKAYSLLEGEGLVERRRGIGLFIADVHNGHVDEIKSRMFAETIDKAAVTAVQLGISERDALSLLREKYALYRSKSRRQK